MFYLSIDFIFNWYLTPTLYDEKCFILVYANIFNIGINNLKLILFSIWYLYCIMVLVFIQKNWVLISIDVISSYWYQFIKKLFLSIGSFNWLFYWYQNFVLKYVMFIGIVYLSSPLCWWVTKRGRRIQVYICMFYYVLCIYVVLLVSWASLHIFTCLLIMHMLRRRFYEAYP